jgi:uncharacterized protein involved in type VI secretion and phage assembly
MAAKANDLFDGGGLAGRDLMGWFGVGVNTPWQRGEACSRPSAWIRLVSRPAGWNWGRRTT